MRRGSSGIVRWGLAAAAALSSMAAPAGAEGLTYRFAVAHQDEMRPSARRGAVWTRGERQLVVYDPGPDDQPVAYDALLARGDGSSLVALNRVNRTYFELDSFAARAGSAAAAAANIPWRAGDAPKLRDPLVEVVEKGEREVAGVPAREVWVLVSYREELDYLSEVVKRDTAATLRLWLSGEVDAPPPPAPISPKSLEVACPEMQARIDQALAAISGFPVRSELTTTVAFEGGASSVARREIALEGFERAAVGDDRFELPAGYREALPEVTAPGLGKP